MDNFNTLVQLVKEKVLNNTISIVDKLNTIGSHMYPMLSFLDTYEKKEDIETTIMNEIIIPLIEYSIEKGIDLNKLIHERIKDHHIMSTVDNITDCVIPKVFSVEESICGLHKRMGFEDKEAEQKPLEDKIVDIIYTAMDATALTTHHSVYGVHGECSIDDFGVSTVKLVINDLEISFLYIWATLDSTDHPPCWEIRVKEYDPQNEENSVSKIFIINKDTASRIAIGRMTNLCALIFTHRMDPIIEPYVELILEKKHWVHSDGLMRTDNRQLIVTLLNSLLDICEENLNTGGIHIDHCVTLVAPYDINETTITGATISLAGIKNRINIVVELGKADRPPLLPIKISIGDISDPLRSLELDIVSDKAIYFKILNLIEKEYKWNR